MMYAPVSCCWNVIESPFPTPRRLNLHPPSQPEPPLPPCPLPLPPLQPQPTPCWFLGPGADRNYWLNLCSSDSSTHRGWLTPSAPEWGELQLPDKKKTKKNPTKTTQFVWCCAAKATSACLQFLICKWNRLWPLSLASRMWTVRSERWTRLCGFHYRGGGAGTGADT